VLIGESERSANLRDFFGAREKSVLQLENVKNVKEDVF